MFFAPRFHEFATLITRFNVPPSNRSITPRRCDRCFIRRNRQSQNLARVSGQRLQRVTGDGIPKPQRFISAGRDETRVAGQECE